MAVMVIKAHCLACKSEQEMRDAKEVTLKNGRKAVKGICAALGCDRSLYRFGALKAVRSEQGG